MLIIINYIYILLSFYSPKITLIEALCRVFEYGFDGGGL